MGTKFSVRNAAPGIPLQKKGLQKKALDFCLKSWSCDRRYVSDTLKGREKITNLKEKFSYVGIFFPIFPSWLVVFDKQFWPTTDALDEMRRQDEWLNIQEHSFSIKKIGQYFRTCKPLSAQEMHNCVGEQQTVVCGRQI